MGSVTEIVKGLFDPCEADEGSKAFVKRWFPWATLSPRVKSLRFLALAVERLRSLPGYEASGRHVLEAPSLLAWDA